MRVLIVGDTHFHNWKYKQIVDFQDRFMNEILPETVSKYKPDILVFLGDIFESRTSVDKRILATFVECLKRLSSVPIIYFVLGNHDIYTASDQNSLKFLEAFANVRIITEPTVEKLNSACYAFLPWGSWEKKSLPLNIKGCRYIFSHIEIKGLKYHPKLEKKSSIGFDAKEFGKGSIIFNGHFHIPTEENIGDVTIINVGSIFQSNVSEVGYKKRLIFLDTTEGKVEEIYLDHPVFVLVESLSEYQELISKKYDPMHIPYYNVSRIKLAEMERTQDFNVFEVIQDLDELAGISIINEAMRGVEKIYEGLDDISKKYVSLEELKYLIKKYYESPDFSILKE